MKMTIRILINTVAVAAILLSAIGCWREKGEALTGSVKIAGSSTVYPVSVAVAEEFSKIHPAVEVPIQSTGTGGGFKNFFIPGKTDINDASRPIKDSELASVQDAGFDAFELRVGTDAVTIVMNPDADWVDDLSVEQLEHIWRPDNPAKKWSDVDSSWPDEEIELYGPTSASGTFDFFTEEVMGEGGASRSDYQGTEQDNTIVQAISGSKYALGYFGMAYYLENKDKVRAMKVNGVLPSIDSAKSGQYTPLSRPLFIYVSTESLKSPEVEEFVRFYINQTNTDMIKEIGYVPLTDEEMKGNLDNFENVIADLQ